MHGDSRHFLVKQNDKTIKKSLTHEWKNQDLKSNHIVRFNDFNIFTD